MWKPLVIGTALVLAVSGAAGAQTAGRDAYDLGKVQVVGKDAQNDRFAPDLGTLSDSMGERDLPMPELLPDAEPTRPRTLQEKSFVVPARQRTKDEVALSLGAGTRGARELNVSGQGTHSGYTGTVNLDHNRRDGYRSNVDDRRTDGQAAVTWSGEGNSQFSVDGNLGWHTFGQRGTRLNPTPDASIEDSRLRLGAKGHATLSDGAFFTAQAEILSASRKVDQPATAFNEDDSLFSGGVKAEYILQLKSQIKGKAGLEVRRDTWTAGNGNEQNLTKRVLALSGEYELKRRSFIEAGVKSLGLMAKNRTAPFLRFDHRWSDPLQFVLTYDEDLGNDRLHDIYMPARYVETTPLTASHRRRWQGTVNYRSGNGNTLGADVFREREQDALETVDFNDPVKGLLVSRHRFADDARRHGLRLRGAFKLDDHFRLALAHTYQTPEDRTHDRRLSYEPKRILDIGFGYLQGALQVDFERRAEFDRIAYLPVTSVGASDYSRSDLSVRYKINETFRAYLKIKDLYDEAKSLRYDVPEEGRVSVVGVEAHF
jgi:hypothetical protein